MKGLFLILFLLPAFVGGQELSNDSFRWGNAFYINLRVGEKTTFNQTEIRLISVFNQFNTLKIGNDTFVIKVSRQTLPVSFDKFRIFVADNRFLKEKSANPEAHGLLKKDVLLCLSQTNNRLLDPVVYKFPVDFTDGFQWSAEEETQMFSFFFQKDGKGLLKCYTHQGIDFDLNDARMQEKHLIVALENSTVVWTEQNKPDQNKYEAAVLLRSESDPGIFYVYEHLNNRKLYVRKGQKINKGDEVGYSWGNSNWGNLQFAVIRSDTVPSYHDRFRNLVNCFPQLFELYTGTLAPMQKATSKGSIDFGRPEPVSGNIKNTLAYEDFSGRGWVLNKWNPADRVESASKGLLGNARLRKTLFGETTIACTDPDNFYDYEINVSPGVYRVRAEVGDAEETSWQKVEFEGVSAGIIELPACIFKWTTERAVKVVDGKLTVRIYFSPDKVAGLSTLVFQKAY
jgi:hypothetical protein